MLAEMTQTVQTSELQARIKLLNDMSEADLRNEMRDLKTTLVQNPSACALLLDEDIGLMVTALRKLTAKLVADTAAKPKSTRTAAAKPAAKKLSAAELQAALDDDDF